MIALASPEQGLRLPVVRTSLVGRTEERAAARRFLLDEAVPLLTLTGPGGVGKTRLALAIANDIATDYADGVVFIDLTPIHDPTLVLPAIAQPLGMRDTAERPLADSLTAALRPQQVLLVLDNCEHVLDAVPAIADLLAACPALQVLATSRAPLRLRGEQVLPVLPFALPGLDDGLEQLAQTDAVALFVQRARSSDSTFALTEANAPVVAEICRRLDGLPLALELAAARLRLLSPEILLERLTGRLQVLSGGERDRPVRHRALRETVAWSYELLTPDEQALFRHLSVFTGGFALDAAEAVGREMEDGRGESDDPSAFRFPSSASVLEGIGALVDESLVTRSLSPTGDVRYGMLETIRAFGSEQLAASGDEASIRDSHAAWCIEIAERSWHIFSNTGQTDDWLPHLTAEHDNLRSALDWLAADTDPARLLRLAGALTAFWYIGGGRREGRLWLERALARTSHMTGSLRALGLQGAARLARNWEEFAHAAEFEQECLANWEPGDDALQIGMARWLQGQISVGQGAYDSAVIYLRQASELFETCGCTWQLESIGSDLGAAALGRGDYTGALELFEEAHALCRARNDLRDITYSLNYIGLTACAVGDGNTARTRSDEAIPLWKRLQSPELIAEGMAVVATIVARFGSPEWSARLFGAADALRERIGHAFTLPEREFFELAQQSVQERLGEQAYTAAFDAGRQLTLDQAIAEAASGQPAPVTPVQAMADPYGLTPREREVFGLLAGRLTDPEIAEALFISPQTASTHVKRVLGKLGVSNRREAAALAARELQA